jgi:putative lipoic acid-binding regulatory protein
MGGRVCQRVNPNRIIEVSHARSPAAASAALQGPPMNQPTIIPPEQSLIEYPVRFPIKVMGANTPEYLDAMVCVARAFEPAFDEASVEQRPSKAGNYMGLTLCVHVTSREQLDELYRTLTTHPLVKYVL